MSTYFIFRGENLSKRKEIIRGKLLFNVTLDLVRKEHSEQWLPAPLGQRNRNVDVRPGGGCPVKPPGEPGVEPGAQAAEVAFGGPRMRARVCLRLGSSCCLEACRYPVHLVGLPSSCQKCWLLLVCILAQ